MLGFVPTSQANFENRQNYSDRLRKTRRENAEEMQRLMAAAAEAGMEVTPEWLASQEATMLTPELMMMGISPREAITQQMMEANNKKAEQARLQQELAGLNREKEFDGALTELVGGWLTAGSSEQDIAAKLAKTYPGMAANAIPRLPNILNRFKGEASARALNDARLKLVINMEDVPEDLKLPFLERPLQTFIQANRNAVMDSVGKRLFMSVQGDVNGPNPEILQTRARDALARTGINFNDKDVKEAVQTAVDLYNQDTNAFYNGVRASTASKALQIGSGQEQRDELRVIEQQQQAQSRYAERMSVFERQADAFVEMATAKGSGFKSDNIPAVRAVLQNYQLLGTAESVFMEMVRKDGNVTKALNYVKDKYPSSVKDRNDVQMDETFNLDVSAGKLSPQEFGEKWSQIFIEDRDRQLVELHENIRNGRASRDPVIEQGIHRQLDARMAMVEQAASSIQQISVRDYASAARRVSGIPREQGGYQSQGSRQAQSIPPAAEQVAPMIIEAAHRHGAPASLMMALAEQESSFNPRAFNDSPGANGRPANAAGLFQYIPSTAMNLGIDPWNPEQASEAAAMQAGQIYQAILRQTGSEQRAIEGAIRHHHGGHPEADGPETRKHLQLVLQKMGKYMHLDGQQQRPQQQGWSRPRELPAPPMAEEDAVPVSTGTQPDQSSEWRLVGSSGTTIFGEPKMIVEDSQGRRVMGTYEQIRKQIGIHPMSLQQGR